MITDQGLHVITGVCRNPSTPITECNYSRRSVIGPSQALQNGPVITCNREAVIGPITSGAPSDPSGERGTLLIEERGTPVNSLSAPSERSENPVTCCQPAPFSEVCYEEHGRRLAAARAEAVSRQPKRCPGCGSVVVMPTFLEPDEWECCNLACCAVFSVGVDR